MYGMLSCKYINVTISFGHKCQVTINNKILDFNFKLLKIVFYILLFIVTK